MLDRGLEADESFYFWRAARRVCATLDTSRPRRWILLPISPSRSSITRVRAERRLGIYGALRVPEIWRFDGSKLVRSSSAPGRRLIRPEFESARLFRGSPSRRSSGSAVEEASLAPVPSGSGHSAAGSARPSCRGSRRRATAGELDKWPIGDLGIEPERNRKEPMSRMTSDP